MKNLEQLCKSLNSRVFQYDVLYVDYSGTTPTLKFVSAIKPKLVKSMFFDDLIGFKGHSPVIKARLAQYARELSNNEVTVDTSFFY